MIEVNKTVQVLYKPPKAVYKIQVVEDQAT